MSTDARPPGAVAAAAIAAKDGAMTNTYDPKITALLCIDFYNDFLSVGRKLWPRLSECSP